MEARDGARFDVVDRRAAAACVALARRWPRSGFDSDLQVRGSHSPDSAGGPMPSPRNALAAIFTTLLLATLSPLFAVEDGGVLDQGT